MDKDKKKAVLVLFAVITVFYLGGQTSFRLPNLSLMQLVAVFLTERSTPYSEELTNLNVRQPVKMDAQPGQAIDSGEIGFSLPSSAMPLHGMEATELDSSLGAEIAKPEKPRRDQE